VVVTDPLRPHPCLPPLLSIRLTLIRPLSPFPPPLCNCVFLPLPLCCHIIFLPLPIYCHSLSSPITDDNFNIDKFATHALLPISIPPIPPYSPILFSLYSPLPLFHPIPLNPFPLPPCTPILLPPCTPLPQPPCLTCCSSSWGVLHLGVEWVDSSPLCI